MNEAPAKIYVDEENEVWIKDTGDTCYIRADIVGGMEEALGKIAQFQRELPNDDGFEAFVACKGIALSSLAKYKGEAQ